MWATGVLLGISHVPMASVEVPSGPQFRGIPLCGSAVATVEATEAAASVKILTGAIIISVIKITIVTFNANSTI